MKFRQAFAAISFIVVLTACAQHAPAPQPSPTATPTAVPAAVPAPMRAPERTAAPTATPQPPSATPTPSATPSPTPTPDRVVLAAPNAAPQIVAVHMNGQTFHGGQTISGTVVTSSNVASVEARIATFSIVVPKVGVGRFALNYTVPNVPFFFHGTYPMRVIARNTAGKAVERVVPITVQ